MLKVSMIGRSHVLLASVASWMIIFRKRQMLNNAEKRADTFEEEFWSGTDLTGLYQEIDGAEGDAKGMELVFESGFAEFTRMRKQGRYRYYQLDDDHVQTLLSVCLEHVRTG